jgi:predicted O-methyltransferase YrrM
VISEADVPVDEAEFLRVIVHGVTAFELLRTALEFGVFERLEAAGGMDADQLADALVIERQPARILLMGLASLRLVTKDGDRYLNTGITRRKLLAGSPRFLGPLVDVQARVINASMTDLAVSARHYTNVGLRHLGGPGTTLYQRLAAHPELQRVFYANLSDVSGKLFAQVMDNFDFTGAHRVIDVGGGDGSNAIALARSFPHLTVTVFDQEPALKLAKRNARDAGVGDQIEVCPGDLFGDALPSEADAILLMHIFEVWSIENNVRLLRKCHAALRPGGAVLIYNFVSNEAGTGPSIAAFMSAYFLTLASGEGMVYPVSDMEAAVREAGFAQIERYAGLGFNHALVVGRK